MLYGIASEDTIFHSCGEAFLDAGDELLGDVTTLNFVHELEAAFKAFINGLNAHDDVGEFTATTGLLLEHFAKLNGLGDGFFICYLRTALITFNLEFTFETVNNDVEVKLSHT